MSAPDWSALKAALGQWNDPDARPLENVDGIVEILNAAYQWLVHGPALEAAEEVWWCEVHDSSADQPPSDFPHFCLAEQVNGHDAEGEAPWCRMVKRPPSPKIEEGK